MKIWTLATLLLLTACGGVAPEEQGCVAIGWQCEGEPWTWAATGRTEMLWVGVTDAAMVDWLEPVNEASEWWQDQLQTDHPVFATHRADTIAADIGVDVGPVPGELSGLATPVPSAECGGISHVDIVFSSDVRKGARRAVAIHELGHALGLEHELGGAMSCTHLCGSGGTDCELSAHQKAQARAALGL